MIPDSYLTLKEPASAKLKVKGSLFIGHVVSVKNCEEAEAFIRNISKEYHDASHNCYAFRFGIGDKTLFRHHDAGEPSGTAGKPILNAIESRNLTDIVCVITRYFGGTKLGTGGLARSYNRCSGKTLDACKKVKVYITVLKKISFPYDLTGTVMSLISNYNCQIVKTKYGPDTVLEIMIRISKTEEFERALLNASSGRVTISGEEVADH